LLLKRASIRPERFDLALKTYVERWLSNTHSLMISFRTIEKNVAGEDLSWF
jgi:hypothetical protein